MTGFDLQLANFGLLLFTSVMAVMTQRFQTRTSVREAIEQLEHHVVGNFNLKAILQDFNYWWWNRYTVVKIKIFYVGGIDQGGAGRPRNMKFQLENNSLEEFDVDEIPDLEKVEKVLSVNDKGISIKLNTINSVECQRATEEILTKMISATWSEESLPEDDDLR